MHFMSIEVASQLFLFHPSPGPPTNFAKKRQERKAASAKQSQSANPSFSHNHLHDLESLWWVAVWIVVYNHFSKSPKPDEAPLSDMQEVIRQLELAQTLFPSFADSAIRQNALRNLFPHVCEGLPPIKETISSTLDILRETLLEHYAVVESTLPKFVDPTASNDVIYDDFKEAWASSCQDYPDVVLTFIPRIRTELKDKLKRARAESESDMTVVNQKRR